MLHYQRPTPKVDLSVQARRRMSKMNSRVYHVTQKGSEALREEDEYDVMFDEFGFPISVEDWHELYYVHEDEHGKRTVCRCEQ